LLSLKSACWKITDFEFTLEGESKGVYPTQNARGTVSYRAPELVNKLEVVMKSDIWALGCIIHELISGKRAFADDVKLFSYPSDDVKQKCPLSIVDGDPRLKTYISQLIKQILKAEWRERPSAKEILQVLLTLSENKSVVHVYDEESKKLGQKLDLPKNSKSWGNVSWQRCW